MRRISLILTILKSIRRQLWMQANRKLRYQSGTNRALFPSYLDAFQWHFSHKIHPFGKHLKLLSDNYHSLTVLIIELTVFL